MMCPRDTLSMTLTMPIDLVLRLFPLISGKLMLAKWETPDHLKYF